MTKREMEALKRRKKAMYRRRRIAVFGGFLIIIFLIYGVFFLMGKFLDKNSTSGSSSETSQSSSVSSSQQSSSSEASSSEETSSEENSSEQSSEAGEESSSSEESSSGESSSQQTTTSNTASSWNLILVNRANPLPDDFTVDLVDITGQYKFDSRAADALKQMLADAEAAGQPMVLRSTYRTKARSEELYTAKVQEFVNNGYSQEDAENEAAKWIAPAGTSEHHTGLAADIVSAEYDADNWDLVEDFEDYAGFEWLYENCANYGFILRYPKDKQEITKITYEPWHYRYVGVEAAKEIMSKGLCLEEYIDLIS